MTYELPLELQVTGITHVKVAEFNYLEAKGQLRVRVFLGNMVDDSFVKHPVSAGKGSYKITITNLEELRASASSADTAPETLGDNITRSWEDALKFIDSNNMWSQLNL